MLQNHPSRQQILAERAFKALEQFLHIEAVSGIVLLAATVIALVWANSGAASSYHDLWHTKIALTLGHFSISSTLHFIINDVFMTIFFLVVGMEIRREMHQGALADIRMAALPVIAALGGVLVPALIYIFLNQKSPRLHGWAIPTATDIAFAVGVLALLGRSIPGNVRIFLLTLAIIDDIAAVFIIALFYSGGLEPIGFVGAGAGILLVLMFQRCGVSNALAYVIPGVIIWFGLLKTGAHPTLAGVVLGLMTPVYSKPMFESPLTLAKKALLKIDEAQSPDETIKHINSLHKAGRELLSPVMRVPAFLHPWVAFGVMPLFALANAGVSFDGFNWSHHASLKVMAAVCLALVVGKPVGVMLFSWSAVKIKLCKLPEGMKWSHVLLIGLLAGIGFTMSIFITMLAFEQVYFVSAAKIGILLGSIIAACLGLLWGIFLNKVKTI